ncbi:MULTISPECIES: bifunctional metallophosphatase/5'-nucleotidase [Variovorax]|jgi:5'-nucleotidase|uniref:bifunctional metallophosphatase/5'-nucleotidase n=1 Tax=Variovorax TaxID=34072 RepID=UPI00086AF5E1|nr:MULTISPECIES: bifunctional metallophosphatase/5'-nucleotidase [Variovorax]MBN8757638.1 bifunctional metallophosphatase/5'-nucleotidase [Variovorax sp.]ODU13225.1 MAG: bifunctional metallophosphatase/5'-nucleotidase [Variovorax sp. SCN 67-85]ODV22024.1 MAG: bifunctional metallophosphatase/5'-nucleotidase [Variovorax sp. SCN 67-20]OJZ07736.1 MAG: bifunctional metallophosphatase/5'-nucleotidase [Variovorax sp. 67-131]UKI10581.1 bifunctional metallophosphatase/5'-nucleotidase [Variovorax parado
MQPSLKQLALASVVLATLTACGGSNNSNSVLPLPPPTASNPPAPAPAVPGTVDVKLIAFNDLHGNLEPPKLTISAPAKGGGTVAVPAGGAAYMASAIAALKEKNPNNAVVSAGDMIGASPLVSALFLDESTIEAVNAMKIDFNAVGNHEFDKGQTELLRMKNGGCAKNTALEPCRVNKNFPGANFGFLAANTVKSDGNTLFPATGMKTFTKDGATVKVAFIGMTLKGTPSIVTPAGVAGLSFKDEADTANALIPQLKAQGADAIVVVVHEGGTTGVGYNDKSCTGLNGDILPILNKLDAAVDVVISGHTHRSYVCDYSKTNPAKPFLLTSAGQYGTLLTDINLTIDTRTRKVTAKAADNVIVQGEAYTSGATTYAVTDQYPVFGKNQQVAALISQYLSIAAPLVQRVVGQLTATANRTQSPSKENVLGNMIADAQLAATKDAGKGGAQIAFMNPGGVRADLVPAADNSVTYGQIFAVQPFGNGLVVKTMTGAQIRAVLEQQFNSGANTTATPKVLLPSASFSYTYNLIQPAGSRITNMALNGTAMADAATYRVTMNSFLATGGDNFTAFNEGTNALGGDQDVDALEAYIKAGSPLTPPSVGRITNATPP